MNMNCWVKNFAMEKFKETQESSNYIGREVKINPKGFTLGIKTKVC
jgi:hypothetical protein